MKRRALLIVAVIVAGLSLRAFGLKAGLPIVIVKYGGSLLWATMVYLLIALVVRRRRWPLLAGAAMTIAISVEAFRLYHAPWLDAFRLTLPGALLLGRIFSLWNIVAYAAGVVLGAVVDAKDTGS